MAQPYLDQEDLKALDHARQRIHQLTNNIASLRADVQRNHPLPEWSSLQTSTSIVAANIQTLTAHLSKHADLLSRTVAYPSTNFPGREHPNVIDMLLRRTLEPHVENWVAEGRVIGIDEKESQDEELWTWASGWIGERVAKYAVEEAGSSYTVEERERGIENVNTGLRRKLEEEDDSSDEEMEELTFGTTEKHRPNGGTSTGSRVDGKARSTEDILRMATSGVVSEGVGRR